MSEDSTKLEFKIMNLSQENNDSVVKLLRQYASENGCADIEISSTDSKFEINFEFCSFGERVIEEMMLELQKHGADNLVCTVWIDSVGEEIFCGLFDGKLLTFESLEALKDYQNEINNPSTVQFNYGKDRNNKTAIIRLQVKGKGKRKKIADLFLNASKIKAENDFVDFGVEFIKLTKPDFHDIKWCAFKWKKSQSWCEGPENLIYGLKFVVEEDVFIYLGFDLEGLDLHGGRSRNSDLEHLIYILSSMDGVSKTWIKFRPMEKTITEQYIYHPGMGDEPMVLRRPLTNDTEWPK